ncbi:hypothetical protein BC332_15331 [Capsicum chinense]|nr:hypothetical protein BC332_15331 [Capsicum chinense]
MFLISEAEASAMTLLLSVESVEHDATVDILYALNVVVQEHESMVTEEQPHAILISMEYFLMGYGLYRPNFNVDLTNKLEGCTT